MEVFPAGLEIDEVVALLLGNLQNPGVVLVRASDEYGQLHLPCLNFNSVVQGSENPLATVFREDGTESHIAVPATGVPVFPVFDDEGQGTHHLFIIEGDEHLSLALDQPTEFLTCKHRDKHLYALRAVLLVGLLQHVVNLVPRHPFGLLYDLISFFVHSVALIRN